jgi:hypothetical protein
MAKDERDILEILKGELNFIEKGGYGRSVPDTIATKINLSGLLDLHQLRRSQPYPPVQRMSFT